MIYVTTCDGHPSVELRDAHNSNIIVLLFATAFNIAFLVYYLSSVAYVVGTIVACVLPICLNYAWLMVSYELKLKSIRNLNAVIGLFIVLGIIALV